jgi:hypothetical protein
VECGVCVFDEALQDRLGYNSIGCYDWGIRKSRETEGGRKELLLAALLDDKNDGLMDWLSFPTALDTRTKKQLNSDFHLSYILPFPSQTS